MEHLEWEIMEYEPRETEREWFWTLGIIVASISITSIISGNILFAILILIAGITLGIYVVKGPDLVKIIIGENGVTDGERFHSYKELDSFSIDGGKLILEKKSLWHPIVIIKFGEDISIERVREYLSQILPEKNHKEPFAHKLMEYFGF